MNPGGAVGTIIPVTEDLMRSFHALIFVAAMAIGGCHKTLDVDTLEKSMREKIETQLAPSKVTTIDCPKGHPLKKDDDFTCKVTLASAALLTAAVHQNNDDGDIEWHVSHYDIDAAHLEAVMTERATQNPKPSFHCPDGAHFDLPGSWVCEISLGGETQRVQFTMQKDGKVTAAPAR